MVCLVLYLCGTGGWFLGEGSKSTCLALDLDKCNTVKVTGLINIRVT